MNLIVKCYRYYCDLFYQLFELWFWRHPTAEDPLVSKWSNAKFHIYMIHIYMNGLRVSKHLANFNFEYWLRHMMQAF